MYFAVGGGCGGCCWWWCCFVDVAAVVGGGGRVVVAVMMFDFLRFFRLLVVVVAAGGCGVDVRERGRKRSALLAGDVKIFIAHSRPIPINTHILTHSRLFCGPGRGFFISPISYLHIHKYRYI